MVADEFRAMVAQGPTVVMVARDDMLRLLDELEMLRERATWWPMVPHIVPPTRESAT